MDFAARSWSVVTVWYVNRDCQRHATCIADFAAAPIASFFLLVTSLRFEAMLVRKSLPWFRLAATLVGTLHGLFVASNAIDWRSICVDGDRRYARVCTTTYCCCRYVMIGFWPHT